MKQNIRLCVPIVIPVTESDKNFLLIEMLRPSISVIGRYLLQYIQPVPYIF